MQEFSAGFGFGGVFGERKRLGSEERFEIAAHGGPGEIGEIGDDSMGWKNRKAFAARIDEGHHGALIRRIRMRTRMFLALLVSIIQRGFVAMVTVGNH